VKECEIERAFVAYCERSGLKALKLRIDGTNGWMDRTVFTSKGPIFFEFKRPRGKLRTMQTFWLLYLESFGFRVVTPRKVGEAEQALRDFLRSKE
jgi:hypothetical protein